MPALSGVEMPKVAAPMGAAGLPELPALPGPSRVGRTRARQEPRRPGSGPSDQREHAHHVAIPLISDAPQVEPNPLGFPGRVVFSSLVQPLVDFCSAPRASARAWALLECSRQCGW